MNTLPVDHAPGGADPEKSHSPDQDNPMWTIGLFSFLVALAFIPLWWTYFTWTWRDGHYQYFPLLIVIIGVLYRLRFHEAREAKTEPIKPLILTGLLLVAAMILAGHVLNSVLIGVLATASASLLATYALVGYGGLRVMQPVLMLWVFATPLPLNYDDTLIFEMQLVASRLASLLLDGIGLMHVREGVVLITETSQYLTEEACSGVRSLFSSLTTVAVYSVACRHRLLRTVFNLCQTVGWVLVGNAIRVAACVYLADNVSVYWASGTGHELLSLAVFAFILAMVANTDKAFGTFVRRNLGVHWSRAESDLNIRVKPTGASSGDQENEAQKEHRRSAHSNSLTDHGDLPSEPATEPALVDLGVSELLSGHNVRRMAFVLLPIALLGWFLTIRSPKTVVTSLDQMPRLPEAKADFLPNQLSGWTQTRFQKVERKEKGLLAPVSYMWTYQSASLVATVSVDCPWSEWHNLNICYTGIGWDTEPSYFAESPDDVPLNHLDVSELSMSKVNGSVGHVMFTAVDRNANEVQQLSWRDAFGNPVQFFEAIAYSISERFGFSEVEIDSLPCSTIQLYVDHSERLTPSEMSQIRALFFDARHALLQSPRWKQD